MKISIADVADRFSICKLKRIHGHDVEEEMKMLFIELSNLGYSGIFDFVSRLTEVNSRIWELESDIRLHKEKELGLEEVGRRAILIRDINNERIAIKNEIVEKYGEGFKETKLTNPPKEETNG